MPVVLNTSGQFFKDAVSPQLNLAPQSTYQEWFDIPDIVSFDHYPLNGWGHPEWVYQPGAMTKYLATNYGIVDKPLGRLLRRSIWKNRW